MEQGKSADREGKVSRRATRMFVEEKKFMDVVTSGNRDEKEKVQEKGQEKELGKEKEKEKSGRRTRSPSTSTVIDVDVRKYPVVDIGKDLSGAFPVSIEDFGNHGKSINCYSRNIRRSYPSSYRHLTASSRQEPSSSKISHQGENRQSPYQLR